MFLGLFGWKWKVRRLRKRWDRTREKALTKEEPVRKMALEKLDILENSLRTIEERSLTRMERGRLAKEVEIGIAEVRGLLETSPEELTHTNAL